MDAPALRLMPDAKLDGDQRAAKQARQQRRAMGGRPLETAFAPSRFPTKPQRLSALSRSQMPKIESARRAVTDSGEVRWR